MTVGAGWSPREGEPALTVSPLCPSPLSRPHRLSHFRGRAEVLEGGLRDVRWLWQCWAGSPGRVLTVGLRVPQGPVFIYAHHFLPPGPLLLPDFCHLFCHLRSWHREQSSFPRGPSRSWQDGDPASPTRPPPGPVPQTRTLSLFATTTKES